MTIHVHCRCKQEVDWLLSQRKYNRVILHFLKIKDYLILKIVYNLPLLKSSLSSSNNKHICQTDFFLILTLISNVLVPIVSDYPSGFEVPYFTYHITLTVKFSLRMNTYKSKLLLDLGFTGILKRRRGVNGANSSCCKMET